MQALLEALENLAESPGDQGDRLNGWLIEAFVAKAIERDRKIDNYAGLIAELEHRAAVRKAEAERLSHRAAVDKALADRLKQLLMQFFATNGLKTLETARYRLTLANNGGKLPVVMNRGVFPDQLPEAFQRTHAEVRVDTASIRAALEAGQTLSFAHLGDRGQHLKIGYTCCHSKIRFFEWQLSLCCSRFLSGAAMKFHILNWGMGVESTAILLLWLCHPETRPFANWNQLIVIVAQTGDEFPETQYLCETYILPLLRELGVRLVQVAKSGAAKADGYTLLSDTCEPHEIFIEGDYKLSESMLDNGYIPRVNRPHVCAIRWKGEVLDALVGDIITAIRQAIDALAMLSLLEPSRFNWQYAQWLLAAREDIQIGPYLGYNSDETKRVKDLVD